MKNDQQKTGILFSLPVCIVATFFVFPIGIILIFMRLYKRGKISKKVKISALVWELLLLESLCLGCLRCRRWTLRG